MRSMHRVSWLAIVFAMTGLAVVGSDQARAAQLPRTPGRTLVLSLPEGKVIVELLPQETEYLLQPESGSKVPYYSIDNAERIAVALDGSGHLDRLAGALLGTAFQRSDGGPASAGPEGPGSDLPEGGMGDLVLDVRGKKIHVPLEDEPTGYLLHPETGDRYIRFSVETGRRISEAMTSAGYDAKFVARTLVGLRGTPPGNSGKHVTEQTQPLPPKPIPEPPCGHCANGAFLCQEVCCNTGNGCTQCHTC